MKASVLLDEIEKVKNFSRDICMIKSDVDFIRGRYVFDAKSVMALFTIDLSIPVDLVLNSNDEEEICLFEEIVHRYKIN